MTAAATTRAYASDLAHFRKWCAANDAPAALPVSPPIVGRYLAALEPTHVYSTMIRRVRAIAMAHRSRGFDFKFDHAAIRQTLAAARRPRRARALGIRELRALVETCSPETLTGIRDRAVLLLTFAAALRRSDIVGLERDQLMLLDDGVHLRISQTDIVIPHGRYHQTCPVRAMRAWLDAASITAGPVFRSVDRWEWVGRKALHPDGVRRIVTRAAQRAGFKQVSPHSLRAGCITEAFRAGASARAIMRHSRHHSYSVLRAYRADLAGRIGL